MENKMTAMQTLMEWMLDESEVIPVDPGDVYAKAKELLAMEKEQMKHVFDEGSMYDYDEGFEDEGFEKYYNETYGK